METKAKIIFYVKLFLFLAGFFASCCTIGVAGTVAIVLIIASATMKVKLEI